MDIRKIVRPLGQYVRGSVHPAYAFQKLTMLSRQVFPMNDAFIMRDAVAEETHLVQRLLQIFYTP